MDKNEVKQRIDIVELIGRTVTLRKEGDHFKGLCPLHDDHEPSLWVNPESQRWRCYGCGRAGDCFSWMMALHGIDFIAALTELERECGSGAATTSVTVWDITDVDGNVLAKHQRGDLPDGRKEYSWYRADGQPSHHDIKSAQLPLYGMKNLFEKPPEAVAAIFIVEGEKAADALIAAGYAALGTITGATSCPNREAFVPLVRWGGPRNTSGPTTTR